MKSMSMRISKSREASVYILQLSDNLNDPKYEECPQKNSGGVSF